jgi:hypothetical protein
MSIDADERGWLSGGHCISQSLRFGEVARDAAARAFPGAAKPPVHSRENGVGMEEGFSNSCVINHMQNQIRIHFSFPTLRSLSKICF